MNPLVGPNSQRGITAAFVAVGLLAFVGMAALAVDLSFLYVARNELQNAADGGALAGARWLYNDDGTAVNEGANQIAYDAATANRSRQLPVEVNWSSGNAGDVQRGHWSFATRTFTANDSTAPPDLQNHTTAELDADPNFINAVRVVARRQATPVVSFFATVFGNESRGVIAEAVGYRGFAGTLFPAEADQPIAICREALLATGAYSCSVGRFINSGQNVDSHETGGWTDFNQDNPCSGGTNANAVKALVCGSGNPGKIFLGRETATSGGDIQSAFSNLITCWANATNKTSAWLLTLPVITCPGNNVGTCEEMVGAVTVQVLWITDGGEDPHYNNAPTAMTAFDADGNPVSWSNSSADGSARWASFVAFFSLQNVDGSPAPYNKKTIYFKPDCKPHEPVGTSGGENFGILAKYPVLVD